MYCPDCNSALNIGSTSCPCGWKKRAEKKLLLCPCGKPTLGPQYAKCATCIGNESAERAELIMPELLRAPSETKDEYLDRLKGLRDRYARKISGRIL